MSEIAILNVFEGIPDYRRKQGRRHSQALCLALFTLAVQGYRPDRRASARLVTRMRHARVIMASDPSETG